MPDGSPGVKVATPKVTESRPLACFFATGRRSHAEPRLLGQALFHLYVLWFLQVQGFSVSPW